MWLKLTNELINKNHIRRIIHGSMTENTCHPRFGKKYIEINLDPRRDAGWSQNSYSVVYWEDRNAQEYKDLLQYINNQKHKNEEK